MKLNIGTGLSLPIEAITQTFAILAKRGVGKTYTGSVMVEEMLSASQQVVVADPIGVWWGLRSSADGKSEGFPIVVFGGEHGDVPLEEQSGELVAQAIIEHGFSAVLDLSLFRKAAQVRFMTAFAETLYRVNRKPLHLMVDEADEFAPQRPMHGTERLLGAFEDIVRRGRARGLGVTLITQRAAVLNKNVLTQIEVLVVLRTISPQDRDAIDAWTEIHGTKAQLKELSESVASLPIGTAWFWSPGWLDVFKRVEVRKRITFDSSSTPKVGMVVQQPKMLAPVDLDKLGAQIKASAEKVKANDPSLLKAEIARLKKEVAAKSVEPKSVEVVREKLVLKDAQIERLEKITGKLDGLSSVFKELISVHRPKLQVTPVRRAAPIAIPVRRIIAPKIERNGEHESLGKCERTLLAVLSQFPEGCSRQKLILLAGYSWSGSTQNALGKLRSIGAVEGSNNGIIGITEAGLSFGPFESLPAGEALVAHWLNFPHFGKCERQLLQCFVENPAGLDREKLLELSGYEWSGSTQNALGALRTAGVIVGRNNEVMQAHPDLLEAITNS